MEERMNNYGTTRDKILNDTYYNMPWKDFIRVVRDYGFQCGFYHSFAGPKRLDEPSFTEEEVIFFHEEKGLILYAGSCKGKSANDAKVFGEIKITDFNQRQNDALENCSYGNNENGTMNFCCSVSKGLRLQLDTLSEVFSFSKIWTRPQMLWLLNDEDVSNGNFNYDKINKQKIAASSPEVKKIIYGC